MRAASHPSRFRIRFFLLAILALALPLGVAAHSASTAWLSLKVSESTIEGTWDIAVRDVDLALTLDADRDGRVTWGEIRRRRSEIEAWALGGLSLATGGIEIPLKVTRVAVSTASETECLQLQIRGTGVPSGRSLTLKYRLLLDLDPMHRGLVRVSTPANPAGTAGILGPDRPQLVIELNDPPVTSVGGFLREGVHHIATGYDHLLFLLALLLPAVVARGPMGWHSAGAPRPILFRVLRIVTAFTLAHSMTLALAAMDWVHPPSRWVESMIAVSIAVSAAANLDGRMGSPTRRERAFAGTWIWRRWVGLNEAHPWSIPLAFGLVHGFGFADGLRELGLSRAHLVEPLFGFNLGVELGQIGAVALVLPILFWAGRTRTYQRWGLAVASWIILAIASTWVLDRSLDLRWFPA